jgi:hypothetical protein
MLLKASFPLRARTCWLNLPFMTAGLEPLVRC